MKQVNSCVIGEKISPDLILICDVQKIEGYSAEQISSFSFDPSIRAPLVKGCHDEPPEIV
jgi:hypothetical protein